MQAPVRRGMKMDHLKEKPIKCELIYKGNYLEYHRDEVLRPNELIRIPFFDWEV